MAITSGEVDRMRTQVAVEAALNEAADRLDAVVASRYSSAPDDSGMDGFYQDDGAGGFEYIHYFRLGDPLGAYPLKPF